MARIMNPWPRRFVFLAALAVPLVLAAVAVRSPWPREDMGDLRDALEDHASFPALAGQSQEGAGRVCLYCHFPHGSKTHQPLWQSHADAGAGEFERASRHARGRKMDLCLSCHDGTVATNLGWHPAAAPGSGGNHPIGVEYDLAAARRPDAFYPSDSSGIALEDGQVACVSCHKAHGVSKAASGDVRADVCTACHRY
ncbi:MAG: hypothetical protein AAB036_07890 [Elusimicrobiota bacterium]